MRKRRTHYGCVFTLLKFHSVKVIVKEIAYKSLKNTKKGQFLRTDHRNHVRENFFKDFLDILWIKNMFKPIRTINRTDSRSIWTRICEDIDHIVKIPSPPPLKKNSHLPQLKVIGKALVLRSVPQVHEGNYTYR